MDRVYRMTMVFLLLFSFFGYIRITRVKLKIESEFIPVFVFSAITCAVYFFGLAGYLFPGAILLLAIGVGFSVLCFYQIISKRLYLNVRVSLFQLAFFVGSLLFFRVLLISRLIHYDNFSHWAIVIKQMLSTNAFPDASSVLIDFKNYPLGASSFIYYICRFAGNFQNIMLIAQGLLIFSCFYAVFGVITEKKRFLLYAFLAMGCSALSFFNLTIRITNLLVDFLLPIYSLALFVIAYKYQNDMKKACITMTPIAGLLMIIKNTGTIYAGAGILFLIYLWIKNRERPLWKSGLIVFFSISAAFVPYGLWSWHVATVFRGVNNKFAISVNHAQTVYSGKSQQEVRQIIALFMKAVFDITKRPAMGVLCFNIAAILASLFAAWVLKKRWNLWKALVVLNVLLIVYYLGILALYIFSMPLDEAIRLAGFERYASSIVVLFAGGLIICATVDIEHSFYYKIGDVPAYRAFKSVENKNRYQKGIIFCTALTITLLMSEYNGTISIQHSYKDTLPYKVYKVTGDRWYPDGKVDANRYLCYSSDADGQVTNYYLQYIAKYMLYAPNVDGICAFYEDNLIHLLSNYDYLVIVESDVEARYLLKKYFRVSGKNGIYKIIHSGDICTIELVS